MSTVVHVLAINIDQPLKALLNLHRVYFAQALREKPEDPLKHKYGPSVMAIYRSGYRVIEFGQRAMSALPQSFFRSTLAWSKVLSAAVRMSNHSGRQET